jgi:putative colanic acid biosynthesis acetyltransferase WcaF
MSVDLRRTTRGAYHPGRGYVVRVLWLATEALLFLNPLAPVFAPKRWVLRLFGARIGTDVRIKPAVHIKYPWRLQIGDYAWIGERVWIDNMEDVVIEEHAVVSQGAYLCTGNHDWSDIGLPLTPKPIRISRGSWVGAFVKVGPGVTVGAESVLTLGSVCVTDTDECTIYGGNPARALRRRRLDKDEGPRADVSS